MQHLSSRKDFPYRASPFSYSTQHLTSARISTTEPTLFHASCSTFPLQGFPLEIISEHNPDTHNTTFTFTGMVGHSYYHLRKDSALTSTDMVGHTYYHLGSAHVYHFPLDGTSIWRTPGFSLMYSNFTLANGLFNTSAISSSIATYWGFTAPLYTISLI